MGVVSALEWLDEVRADLDKATPGPWGVEVTDWEVSVFQHDQPDDPYAGFGRAYVCQNLTQGETEGEADARLIASAPDRLDRMERALRAVLHLAEAVNAAAIIPTSTPIMNTGYRLAMGDVVTAIKEELGDE